MQYKACAPGSLMLMGEHAVLYQQPAIAVALKNRVKVTLIPRTDDNIVISSILGKKTFNLNRIAYEPPFQFVTATLCHRQNALPSGFDLQIDSEFSDKMGLGSSAAVVVATLAVLDAFCNKSSQNETIFNKRSRDKSALLEKSNETLCNELIPNNPFFKDALSIVHKVQDGIGSGLDLLASMYGGIIFYKSPDHIEKLQGSLPLVIYYSGFKVKTSIVVKQVAKTVAKNPDLFQSLFSLMGKGVMEAKAAIQKNDLQTLGQLMNLQHGLLSALGVSNSTLDNIVHALRKMPKIYGAKISGAGLGDSCIGLGEIGKAVEGGEIESAGISYGECIDGERIDSEFSSQGCYYEYG